jgi:hypothetical protein
MILIKFFAFLQKESIDRIQWEYQKIIDIILLKDIGIP